MKLAKITLALLIATTLIMAIPLHQVLAAEPTEPHNADSMWIEPSVKDVSVLSIGEKFNVTVWINVSLTCGAWQFKLIYNKSYLNATECGYTAGAKSDFFKNVPTTVPVTPSFESYNTTHNFVQHGESWLGGTPAGPGYGSLSWVEFQVMAEMTELPLTLDISSAYHPPTSDTYALNFETQAEIPLNVSDANIIPEFIPLLILAILSTITVIAVFASKVLRPKLDKTSIKK